MITRSRARALAAQNYYAQQLRGTSLFKARLLMRTERKLAKSFQQVALLNDTIRGLSSRYSRARTAGFKSFRYNLRVRLSAFEGVRNVFYEYAKSKAEEVVKLRRELFGQNVRVVYESESDEADDEYETTDDEMEVDDGF